MVLRSESGLYNWPGIQEKTLSYPANSISLTLKLLGLGAATSSRQAGYLLSGVSVELP